MVVSGKCQTAVDVQRCLKTEESIGVSTQTIRRVFQRNGLAARVKQKKPLLFTLLLRRHRQSRLTFARKHSHWTAEDWKRVVWSDESKFNTFGSDGREWVWEKSGVPSGDSHVQPTVKHE
jgi:tRNA/tmRNA/rRNA uracil-C5-methylase (TrmA/RlmC/RlmD family)